ncbi:MAG: hypothetical protein ABR987_20875 [Terracidiphilus sp.]|jgi:hypothetical protein
MQTETVNIVLLLCDLSEASDEVFRESEMGSGCHGGLQQLAEMGAIERGPRPETVACAACDADHPAVIEYDAERRCYVHFCPEAGFVTVNDADLVTQRFRPEWLVDWLTKALPITSPLGRPALIQGRVWPLGDAACGDTRATIVFARRISSQADFDLLAATLRPAHPADRGLVITTTRQAVRQVPLPGGYELIPLPEIVRLNRDGLMLDTVRLGSWIRGMPASTAKGAPTRPGRPSPQARILQIFHARRGRGLPVVSYLAEAEAILAEWPQHASDQKPPNVSTVRRHVSHVTKDSASP